MDARSPTAARRRGPWPRGQRRADGARADDAADDGGATHLHAAVRIGIVGRDGGAVGAAWLAARARKPASAARARRALRRRLRVDGARTLLGISARGTSISLKPSN